MNNHQRHRGPDDAGIFASGPIAMGATRLAIIDIAGGSQPMTSPDGRLTITFNGEIYNHAELRRYCSDSGWQFRSHCDTEVLLASFAIFGKALPSMLNGMFAFAVWDRDKRELFVARDQFGIKPLYYHTNDERLVFSSELTALLAAGDISPHLDTESLCDFLSYWYVVDPKSIIKDVQQLPAGCWAIAEPSGFKVNRYWSYPVGPEDPVSVSEADHRIEELLEDAVKLRLHSDVPYGLFLSGGIDSGLIAAMARRSTKKLIPAYSVGFSEASYSELTLAQKTADQQNLNFETIVLDQLTPEQVLKTITAFDEPLGNSSFIPTYYLAKRASSRVKMVLSGDGGDELFGGYPTYQAPFIVPPMKILPSSILSGLQRAISLFPVSHRRISFDYRLRRFLPGIALPTARAHASWREVADSAMRQRLFSADMMDLVGDWDPLARIEELYNEAQGLDKINRLLYLDLHTYLIGDHLRKVDRMSMAHSLEVRIPFLDVRLVEYCMAITGKMKVSLTNTKMPLRRLAARLLPQQIARASKAGLTVPIAGWINGGLREFVDESLRGSVIDHLFRRDTIETLLQEHRERHADHSRLIWALVTLRHWLDRMEEKGYRLTIA